MRERAEFAARACHITDAYMRRSHRGDAPPVASPTPAGDLQRKAGRENRREPEHNLTNGRSYRTRSGDIAVAQAGATDCLWHAAAGVHGLARQHYPGERAAKDRS